MSTQARENVERWALAALSLLALAWACWMWLAGPWPSTGIAHDAWAVRQWRALVELHHLQGVAGFLPGLISVDLAMGAALALSLCLLPNPTDSVRDLRRALALSSPAVLYLLHVRLQAPLPAHSQSFATMLAAGVCASAGVDLLAFLVGYPRRLRHEEVLAISRRRVVDYRFMATTRQRFDAWLQRIDRRLPDFGMGRYGTESQARQLADSHVRMLQIMTHPLFRAMAVAIAAAAAFLATRPGTGEAWARFFGAGIITMSVVFLFAAFGSMSLKYRFGDVEARRQIGWIYLGPLAGTILVVTWVYLLPAIGLLVPDTFVVSGPRLFGMNLTQLWFVGVYGSVPVLVASFLLGLAFSVFYSGSLDPRLAMRRSLVAGTCGLVLTAGFVAVENLVSAQVTTRFGMPDSTGSVVAGTLAAVAFSPLRVRIERLVSGWLARLMPEDPAPGTGDQADPAPTYSTTSSP